MGRFAVSYARMNGTEIRSRAESFDSLDEAALFFNKMCVDAGKNFSITICDTKTNVVLKHYAHNHFPYRFVYVQDQESEAVKEPSEAAERPREEALASPEEYNNY